MFKRALVLTLLAGLALSSCAWKESESSRGKKGYYTTDGGGGGY